MGTLVPWSPYVMPSTHALIDIFFWRKCEGRKKKITIDFNAVSGDSKCFLGDPEKRKRLSSVKAHTSRSYIFVWKRGVLFTDRLHPVHPVYPDNTDTNYVLGIFFTEADTDLIFFLS